MGASRFCSFGAALPEAGFVKVDLEADWSPSSNPVPDRLCHAWARAFGSTSNRNGPSTSPAPPIRLRHNEAPSELDRCPALEGASIHADLRHCDVSSLAAYRTRFTDRIDDSRDRMPQAADDASQLVRIAGVVEVDFCIRSRRFGDVDRITKRIPAVGRHEHLVWSEPAGLRDSSSLVGTLAM